MISTIGKRTLFILAVILISAYGIFGVPTSMKALRDNIQKRISLGLDLRGGTHLVLQPAHEPIPAGTKAPFDLMVDDIVAARQHYGELGLNPSALESGMVHRSFTLSGPDGYTITVTSSHTGGRVV